MGLLPVWEGGMRERNDRTERGQRSLIGTSRVVATLTITWVPNTHLKMFSSKEVRERRKSLPDVVEEQTGEEYTSRSEAV